MSREAREQSAIEDAWEGIVHATMHNEYFKRFLKERNFSCGYLSDLYEVDGVFDYMIEHDWDYAIKEPVRAFCQNYDRYIDEKVSLQEDIGYDNYSPIILDEHMNKYNSKLERV